MTLMYLIFSYGLALFNLYRGVQGMNAYNFVFAAIWLVLGVVYTVKYIKENQKKDKE